MAYKFLLVMFGWSAVIASALIVLVPFIRRKLDLVNSWTIFQISCINFIGITAIQSGNCVTHLYTEPRDQDYIKFVLGGAVFYLSSTLTYFYFKFPARLAMHFPRKWAPRTSRVMLALLPFCVLGVLGYIFVPNIQFLGQWMVIFGRAAGTIGVIFCIIAWAQQPLNVALPLVTAGVLGFAVLASNHDFGRRDFLSTLSAVPIAWYWLRGRYMNPVRLLGTMMVYFLIGVVAITGISVTRFKKANPDLTVFQAAWAKVRAIPEAFSTVGSESMFGGDACDASLAAIHLYDGVQAPQPFFTLKYVAEHWIPREWWPEKAEALGSSLPRDIGWNSIHGYVNLGPGAVGHGYHEGGLIMLVFYGVFFASIMRWFDTALANDPTNPFLLGALAGCSGQIFAFTRGDWALFSVLIFGSFISAMFINYIARFFFGTDQTVAGHELPVEMAAQAGYTVDQAHFSH